MNKKTMMKFEDVSLVLEVEKSFSTGDLIKNIFATAMKTKKKQLNVSNYILNGLSFEAFEGDVIGLTGSNGAGKSTLLRTMAGVYAPDFGKITIHGKVSSVIDLGAGIDYTLSGKENIVRLGLMRGFSKSSLLEKMDKIIEFSGLEDSIYHPVRVYSSGMVLRLMFSVATEFKPEILLIDEMFGVGDADFQAKAQERMEKLIEDSSLVFFASHSDALIKQICNRVFELENGRLVRDERLQGT
jgi:ABC-type polysaccharide/polyol phosphate transport system ATPase subunit